MNGYLNEIKKALDCELYILALNSALALPDLCAKLESPNFMDTSKVGQRYRRWYDTYAKKYCYISADLCYSYRNSMIHSHSSYKKDKVTKIAFPVPGTTNCVMMNSKADITVSTPEGKYSDKATIINIIEFVKGMIKAVEEWLEVIKENKNYINNYPFLLQVRPNSPLSVLDGGLYVY